MKEYSVDSMSHSLSPWYPLNNPYFTPVDDPFLTPFTRKLDCSSDVARSSNPSEGALLSDHSQLRLTGSGVSQHCGHLFGDPYNEDHRILVSVLGYPNLTKLPSTADE